MDELTLSEATQAALQSFLVSQKAIEITNHNDMSGFKENWQLSQFWYNQKCASTLAKEIFTDKKVGFVSIPSVFIQYKRLYPENECTLFEFDDRFNSFKEFHHFDYKLSLITPEIESKYDCIIVDPPFFSEECLTKMMKFVDRLATLNCKIIVCTGLVMTRQLVNCDFELTKYELCHEKGFANDYGCFLNYNSSNDEFRTQ